MKFNTGPNFTSQKTSLWLVLLSEIAGVISMKNWDSVTPESNVSDTASLPEGHFERRWKAHGDTGVAQDSFPPGESIIHQSLFCRRTARGLADFSCLPPFSWRNARVKGIHYRPCGCGDPHSGPHAFTVSASPTGPSSQPPIFYADRDFIQFFQNDNGVTWSLCPQLLCRLITHKEKISLKQNLWGFDRVARSAHLFHSEVKTVLLRNSQDWGLNFCSMFAFPFLLIAFRCLSWQSLEALCLNHCFYKMLPGVSSSSLCPCLLRLPPCTFCACCLLLVL